MNPRLSDLKLAAPASRQAWRIVAWRLRGAVAAGGERARAGARPLRLPLRRRRCCDDARRPAGRRLAARRRRRAAARRRQPVLAAHRCRAPSHRGSWARAASPRRTWKSPCSRATVARSPAARHAGPRDQVIVGSDELVERQPHAVSDPARRGWPGAHARAAQPQRDPHGRGPGPGRAGRAELQLRPPGSRPVLCPRHAGGGRAGRARPRPRPVRLCRALRLARPRRMAEHQPIAACGPGQRRVAARRMGWRLEPAHHPGRGAAAASARARTALVPLDDRHGRAVPAGHPAGADRRLALRRRRRLPPPRDPLLGRRDRGVVARVAARTSRRRGGRPDFRAGRGGRAGRTLWRAWSATSSRSTPARSSSATGRVS